MGKISLYSKVTTLDEAMTFFVAIDTDADGTFESRGVTLATLRESLSPAPTGFLQPVYIDAAPQALSGAGAVDIVSPVTNFTSTGATDALTLVDSTVIGQVKVINHEVDGGGYVLTPTTLSGGTTITVTDVGVSITLMWTTSGWLLVSQTGVATIA
ncbi:MAG: hypothetical protein ACYTFK_11535 [Planctomycetota bacterium]|jgi:hypothetical protein